MKPETSTVETNDWKIWAYEHMYTAKDADEATQAFIDFMMSDEVQGGLVSENGYISVSGMKVSRDADGNVTLTDGEESFTFPIKSAGYVKLCDDEDLFS